MDNSLLFFLQLYQEQLSIICDSVVCGHMVRSTYYGWRLSQDESGGYYYFFFNTNSHVIMNGNCESSQDAKDIPCSRNWQWFRPLYKTNYTSEIIWFMLNIEASPSPCHCHNKEVEVEDEGNAANGCWSCCGVTYLKESVLFFSPETVSDSVITVWRTKLS